MSIHPGHLASDLQQPVPDVDIQQSASSGQDMDTSGSAHESNGLPLNQAPADGSMSQPNENHNQSSTSLKHEASQPHGPGLNATRSNQDQTEGNNEVPPHHVLPVRPAPREKANQVSHHNLLPSHPPPREKSNQASHHPLPSRLGPHDSQVQSPMKPQMQAQSYGQPHSQQSRHSQQSDRSQLMPPAGSRVQNVVQQAQINQQGLPPHRRQPTHNPATMVQHEAPKSNYTQRPTPQNRQLYDPRKDGSRHNRHARDGQQKYGSTDPVRDQIMYLETLASIEIPKAEMGQQELEEKENLRLSLEQICRGAVTEYERKTGKDFDASMVVLKCFGSLSSGFATHSSDMDLAILSPKSTPPISSIESEIPRLLEKVFLELGFGVRLLTRTRVPIIKFCEKPTPALAQALLDEREKWEKERDAPPKPKVDGSRTKEGNKESKNCSKNALGVSSTRANDNAKNSSKRSGVPTSNSDHQAEDKTEKFNKPEENSDLSPKSDKADYTKNGIETSGAPTSNSNHSNYQAEDKTEKSNKPGENPDSSPKSGKADDNTKNVIITSGAPTSNSNHQAEDKTEKSNKPKENSDSSPKSDKANDPKDVFRSDDELVYLYNLAMDEGWYDAEERRIIKNFCLAVSKHGPGSEDALLQTARLGLKSLTNILQRYRPPIENHLDFPKKGVGIQCDINFSNPLALHNTLLLKCYSLCDPRVRPMILFVKAWAKRRNINSPYHGTLSSYGYVLMVLHYLVNIVNPSIAPNLQTTRKAAQDKSPGNNDIIDGYGVRFWREETEIQNLAQHGMLTRNSTDTVGSLLRGFFHYYAQQGFYSPSGGFSWTKDVLSLRSERGLLTKQSKDWTGARTVTIEPTVPGGEARDVRHRYLLAIEDPFETDHNIARTVVHKGIVAIREEFRRAHMIIQSVGRAEMQDLFAQAETREHLGWRAFGPLPKKDDASVLNKDQPAAGHSSRNEEPVSGVKAKIPSGNLPKEGEPACRSDNKPTEGFPSKGKPDPSNKEQPAKKAWNGNQSSSHNKNPLVKDAQVPSVVNESSSITPPNRDSAKRPLKRRHRRNKENFNDQDGSKPGPSHRGKPGPADNPTRNEIKDNEFPTQNDSTLTPGVGGIAPSSRGDTSGSKSASDTQESTYMHDGLVCNIHAPHTLPRDPAPTIQDPSLSDQQNDTRVPDGNPDNGSTGTGDAASLDSDAKSAASTTVATSPEE